MIGQITSGTARAALAMALALATSLVYAQSVINTAETFSLDDPEGWAMAHTLSAALNLGSPPVAGLAAGELGFSAELGSIPRLSRSEQRVGFGGFKFEDMNKSPVFGRGRLHVGLPLDFNLELSWTPPVEINGGKPDGIYGLALQRHLLRGRNWNAAWRLFTVQGKAQGDITCSRDVASHPPASPGNPFGCLEPSDDRIELDHEGLEFATSRLSDDGRWQPFAALAVTKIHPRVSVRARLIDSIDRSRLRTDGTLQTVTLGTLYHLSPNWSGQVAISYTPLQVRRPPDYSLRDQDYWSVRLGLRWSPGWSVFQ